jgi:hypothetical protein
MNTAMITLNPFIYDLNLLLDTLFGFALMDGSLMPKKFVLPDLPAPPPLS